MDKKILVEMVEESIRSGTERLVVGAVIRDSKKRVLFLERPQDDFMGGIFELPSGKVEKGESLLEALRREVKEETNLEMQEIQKVLPFFDYYSCSGKKTRQFNFLIKTKDTSKVVLTEHDRYIWASKDDLSGMQSSKEVLKVLSKISE